MLPSERSEGGFCQNKTIDSAVDDCSDKAQPGQRRENAPTGAVLLFTKILAILQLKKKQVQINLFPNKKSYIFNDNKILN